MQQEQYSQERSKSDSEEKFLGCLQRSYQTKNNLNSLIYRDDRQAYLNLQTDCKELKTKIDSLDGKCCIEMIKRFGEGVSMHDIDSFAVNRTLEEMKELSKSKEQSLYDGMNRKLVS